MRSSCALLFDAPGSTVSCRVDSAQSIISPGYAAGTGTSARRSRQQDFPDECEGCDRRPHLQEMERM